MSGKSERAIMIVKTRSNTNFRKAAQSPFCFTIFVGNAETIISSPFLRQQPTWRSLVVIKQEGEGKFVIMTVAGWGAVHAANRNVVALQLLSVRQN